MLSGREHVRHDESNGEARIAGRAAAAVYLSDRTEKQPILGESVATTGSHRKCAIHLLNHPPKRGGSNRRPRAAKDDGAVRAAREWLWRAEILGYMSTALTA